MARKSARKLEADPSMVHTEVLRQFNGDVSMASATSSSFSGVSGTTQLQKFGDLLAYTSATLTVTATAGSPTTANLLRNGTTILSITAGITPASATSQTQVTHTTPINAPTYTVSAVGGTVTGSVTVARENRL